MNKYIEAEFEDKYGTKWQVADNGMLSFWSYSRQTWQKSGWSLSHLNTGDDSDSDIYKRYILSIASSISLKHPVDVF